LKSISIEFRQRIFTSLTRCAMLAISCASLALSFGLNVPARAGDVRMAVEVRTRLSGAGQASF